MNVGLFAEASPCCPSPLIGQLVTIAYVAGGVLVYTWVLVATLRWVLERYHRRDAAPERNG